jgi:hypothetical protein
MIDEEVLASGAMGLMLGLFAFTAGVVRVRYWASRKHRTSPNRSSDTVDARYSTNQIAPSAPSGLRAALQGYFAFERLMDLLVMLFFVAMLLYGAWVAPRLRLILLVAGFTAIGCSFVWVKTRKWLLGRRQSKA